MIYVFLGPPGCGKGSQAQSIHQKIGIKIFSAGDLLRKEIADETDIGKQVKQLVEQGNYVPDQIIWDITRNTIDPSADKDLIIDGYPRTVKQAELFLEWAKYKSLAVTIVCFSVDSSVLLERIINRRMCGHCGAIYNLKTQPPKIENVCDFCGISDFKKRTDDDAEILNQRLQQDQTKSKPVIDFFEAQGLLCKVDASQKISAVTEQVLAIIKKESHGTY